ncbi:MAG: 50S ribosomal protein L3 N(5)-glutamine methyltransferase [Pseudomonadales bacterium]
MPTTQPTVGEALEHIAQRFADADLHFGHGTDSAWDEAAYLVLSIAELPDDAAQLQQSLSEAQWQQIAALAQRRVAEKMPLAYLLQRCQYAGHDFRINPGVLIPRSPLGPWLLQHGVAWMPEAPRRILDLCTGSGCLGIIAAHAFPDAIVLMTDRDSTALKLAQENIRDHDLAASTVLLQMDGLSAFATSAQFDLVLCNPPYVNATDMAALPVEYQQEPAQALAAGDDGLAVIAPILDRLPQLLSERGLFLGEVGLSAAALQRRYPDLPFIWLDFEQGGEGVFALTADQLRHTA